MDAGADPRHLDPRVLTVWRIKALVAACSVGLLILVVAVAAAMAADTTIASVAPVLASVAVAAVALGLAWWLPAVHYRRWTYLLGETTLQLDHGVLVRTRSVIPYFRVQHVDTEQGPIERRLGLTNLTIRTASSATDASLPGLADAEAARVRTTALQGAGAGDAA